MGMRFHFYGSRIHAGYLGFDSIDLRYTAYPYKKTKLNHRLWIKVDFVSNSIMGRFLCKIVDPSVSPNYHYIYVTDGIQIKLRLAR